MIIWNSQSGIEANAMQSDRAWNQLENDIIACEACPRLRAWCAEIAQSKRKAAYRHMRYWGKPVPGFGDRQARLVIIGLAPAAHGANRTGRMFTGDESGNWLYEALYRFGFANQPHAVHRDDGLTLRDAYILSVVRCAPPDNKPTAGEVATCRRHLVRELELLHRKRVILTLGQLAFREYLRYRKAEGKDVRGLVFRHGALYQWDDHSPSLLVSYHPSQQNTRTGVLRREAWHDVFRQAREILSVRQEPNEPLHG
jgi:uracil-DNA glycosylase family 4